MDDAFRLELLDGVFDGRLVFQISFDEFRARIDRLAMSVQQRVENADFMAAFQKVFGCATADVACAASNKYFHDVSFSKSFIDK